MMGKTQVDWCPFPLRPVPTRACSHSRLFPLRCKNKSMDCFIEPVTNCSQKRVSIGGNPYRGHQYPYCGFSVPLSRFLSTLIALTSTLIAIISTRVVTSPLQSSLPQKPVPSDATLS